MGIDFTFHLQRNGDGRIMAFEVGSAHNEVWTYLNAIGQKTNDHFRVRVDPPFRPRRTGFRSGSARLHGHCEDISAWILDDKGQRVYTPEQVKEAMKRMTAGEGLWRTHMTLDGREEPVSEADASMEEETAINRVLQKFADEHGIFLTEYRDPEDPKKGTYKSLGGRTYEEMCKYWEGESHEQKKSTPQ